jgi:hypothetical protein
VSIRALLHSKKALVIGAGVVGVGLIYLYERHKHSGGSAPAFGNVVMGTPLSTGANTLSTGGETTAPGNTTTTVPGHPAHPTDPLKTWGHNASGGGDKTMTGITPIIYSPPSNPVQHPIFTHPIVHIPVARPVQTRLL